MKIRGLFVALFVCLWSAGVASAQQSAPQGFQVVVPTSLAIIAPTSQTITHDQSDSNQAFAKQRWTVKGNVLNGVNVSFKTATAFTHMNNSAFKRDAQLALELAGTQGSAVWTINTPVDATNYGSADETAIVNAMSNGAGRANFDLTVTFVTGEFGSFAAGNYALTVVGTVAAN